jgi:hypothetical protein
METLQVVAGRRGADTPFRHVSGEAE